MAKDTRRILRGVRMGGKTITDPDELEQGLTQEQVDDLKDRGAIMGDWKPGGKGFAAASPRADRKSRKKQRQATTGTGFVDDETNPELGKLRKENEQLKSQLKDFYQGQSQSKDGGHKDAAKDQGKPQAQQTQSGQQQPTTSHATHEPAKHGQQTEAAKSDAKADTGHQQHQGSGKKK